MNFSKQFIRKLIYITLITGLLIPLSFIGRPSTRDAENAIVDQGGVLSQLRNEHELSQASLSEIDPASETMKLGSLGLRGLAVSLLWLQAIEAKDRKEWDKLTASLETLVKLQPNFIGVWKFQAHNISYNVSVEFDDYENRYEWVCKGIDFLTRGISANKRDHRIQSELGQFSTKFGIADERVHFRRLFREDDGFHTRMGEFINSDNLDTGAYGKDHWLLAHEWYRSAEEMVDQGVDGRDVKLRTTPTRFYQFKPAQQRNLMLSLQEEFRVEPEFAEQQWGTAFKEWTAYGTRQMLAASGLEFNLEREGIRLQQVNQLRTRLDKLAPGHRTEFRAKAIDRARKEKNLTNLEFELLKKPLDSLTDRERNFVRRAEAKMLDFTRVDEFAIAEFSSEDDRVEANRLAADIVEIILKMETIESHRAINNYTHWSKRTEAEASDTAINARHAEYDASELYRKSIYMSYDDVDPVTGKRVKVPGAIEEYERSYEFWAQIMEGFPDLKNGPLMDDLADSLSRYSRIRQEAGLIRWIRNHPLQAVVDEFSAIYPEENLITSAQLEQMLQNDQLINERSYGLPRRPIIDFKLD